MESTTDIANIGNLRALTKNANWSNMETYEDRVKRVKSRKETICRLTGKDDEDKVSRNQLLEVVVEQDKVLRKLTRELFFANPTHSFFDNIPEAVLAPLRVQAILRRA